MSVEVNYTGLEIAIIGMAGRVPGAEDLNIFWKNLIENKESISTFSEEELIAAGVEKELIDDPNFLRAKGIIPNLEGFDAEFFNYTPREASIMDPQVRILHEEVYHALEDAGYASKDTKETIGVYVGLSNNFVWELDTIKSTMDLDTSIFPTIQLNDKDSAATRISYSLNLRGPSITVQSACSTSLSAIDTACRHILTGACSIAVAGGSGLSLPSKNGYLIKDGRINSPDGHCRPFDYEAAGTIEGNGVAVVVLKMLEDAIKDKDRVYAVIKGTATNNDGDRKVGYTAPSIEGQAEAIQRSLGMANVSADTISYIEAHGTGTILGDPIEVASLKKAYNTAETGSIGIGSLKSNIGHLDSAAGAISLIKTALSLKNKVIPATVNFRKTNPKLNIENSPFYVVSKNQEWKPRLIKDKRDEFMPLRAGVSSFGLGGTNIHMILEEAPKVEISSEGREWNLLCLSAYSDNALERMKKSYLDYLRGSEEDKNPSDLAWTLQTRQRSLAKKFTLPFTDIDDLVKSLSKNIEAGDSSVGRNNTATEFKPSVYFLFPGYGSQYAGMAADLYEKESVFRKHMDTCLKLVEEEGIKDLRRMLLNPQPGDDDILAEPDISQLALFVIEYSLAKLLLDWGIKPKGMIGHSLGEYSAACLSGVFTIQEGIQLVIARGNLMKSMPNGAMLSVNASAETVTPLLTEGISIATINSSNKCTVSGHTEAIEDFEKILSDKKILSIKLSSKYAFHSILMEGAKEPYGKICSKIDLREPQIPYISNLTGNWITTDEATDFRYYAKHLRGCVNFAKGIKTILDDERAILVEVGPGRILSAFAIQADANKSIGVVNMLRDPEEEYSDDRYLVERIGDLWSYGVPIDWKKYYENQVRNPVTLPLYPFEPVEFPIGRNLIGMVKDCQVGGVSKVNNANNFTNVNKKVVTETLINNDPQLSVGTIFWKSTFSPNLENDGENRTCLIISNMDKVVKGLMKNMPRWRCFTARYGQDYIFDETLTSSIRLNNSSDMHQLFKDYKSRALLPNTVIIAESTVEGMEAKLRILVKAIEENYDSNPSIIVLSPKSPAYKTPGLTALIKGIGLEHPDISLRLIDAGVQMDTSNSSKWASIIQSEVDSNIKYPTVVYENNMRLIPTFRALDISGSNKIQTDINHLAFLCDEKVLVKSLYMVDKIVENLGVIVSVIPYRLHTTATNQKAIRYDKKIDNSRVQIMPVAVIPSVSAVDINLREALGKISQLDGIIYWDELQMKDSTSDCFAEKIEVSKKLNSFVSKKAKTLKKAVIISSIFNESKWSSMLTDLVVQHEVEVSAGVYRIYLPIIGDNLENILTRVLKKMLESDIRRVVVSPEAHPFLSLKAQTHNLLMDSDIQLTDMENLLKKSWCKLFGLDDIQLDSDFFKLGGDSFKIIQMSVDLEKAGHKLMMNEIYKYSTIRTLARYLFERKDIPRADIITSNDLQEEIIQEKGIDCRYCNIKETTINVLLIDEKFKDSINMVRNYIKSLNISVELQPHYIFTFPLNNLKSSSISIEKLVNQGYLEESEKEVYNNRLNSIEEQDRFNQAIISQPVKRYYELSHGQKMHFRGEARLQLYNVNFYEMIDEDLLEQALCDIIASHGLLRSTLDRHFGQYRWKEYEPPKKTPIPKLDISHLTPNTQKRFLDLLVAKEWSSDFKRSGMPMYHLILIKWNEKHYELFFQFDHSVIDFTSGQVIQRQLHKRYRDLKRGVRTAMEFSTSYKEFVDQIKKGPVGVDSDQLIDIFDLKEYREKSLLIDDRIAAKRGRIQLLSFTLDLSEFNLSKVDEYVAFEIAFQVKILTLARLLDVDALPFMLYYVNRRYQEKTFTDLVGFVLDGIPMLIPVDRENPARMTSLLRERVQLITRYNINFSSLDLNTLTRWKWRKVVALNTEDNKTIRGRLVLNHGGYAEEEYSQIWERTLKQLDVEDQSKLDYGDFYGLSRIDGNIVTFLNFCKFEDDMDYLKKVFDEEIDHLKKVYNKNNSKAVESLT